MCGDADGFWYADAELTNTYWRVRSANKRRSRSTSANVKATKLATTSNDEPNNTLAVAASSFTSAQSARAPNRSLARRPRLSTNSSYPRSSNNQLHAPLMLPVPPMIRMRIPSRTIAQRSQHPHGEHDRQHK